MSKKSKLKQKRSIELVLLSRLRWVGCILYLWALGFLIYAMAFTPLDEPAEQTPVLQEASMEQIENFSPHDAFNFFLLSVLFFSLGATCHFTSHKRLLKVASRVKK